jgi:hypothetical protein
MSLLLLVFRILEAMFVIGLLGCLVVIPSAAYELFRVLFEHNVPEEPEKSR